MKNRIEWIDLAKGMSIILVVYGHSGLSGVPILGEWFSSFRMPFFFLVSGLLFNSAKYSSLAAFVHRKWTTLLRPFFIFSFIVLAGYGILEPGTVVKRVTTLLLKGWGGYALWFIPVLFATETCYYIICRLSKKKWIKTSIVLFLALLGFASYRLGLANNWNICFVLTSTLFYGMGNIMSYQLKEFYATARPSRLLIVAFSCFLVSCCSLFNYPKPEFGANLLGGGILTHVCGFAGTLFMCCFAVLISKWGGVIFNAIKFGIKYMGKNSYVVLAFHQITLHCLSATGMMPNGMVQRLLMWIMLILLIEFITRYTPAVLGRKLVPKVQLT